jgi:hypothetical protein
MRQFYRGPGRQISPRYLPEFGTKNTGILPGARRVSAAPQLAPRSSRSCREKCDGRESPEKHRIYLDRKRSMGSLQRHSHLALVRRGRQIMTPANFRRKSSLSRRPPSTRRPAIRFVRLLHGMTADCEQDGYARLTRQAFSSAR